jgi:hypothetical protein
MMERYSHIRMEAKRRAVDDLSGTDFEPGVAQNWAQLSVVEAHRGGGKPQGAASIFYFLHFFVVSGGPKIACPYLVSVPDPTHREVRCQPGTSQSKNSKETSDPSGSS